jgi:hypothetical protein
MPPRQSLGAGLVVVLRVTGRVSRISETSPRPVGGMGGMQWSQSPGGSGVPPDLRGHTVARSASLLRARCPGGSARPRRTIGPTNCPMSDLTELVVMLATLCRASPDASRTARASCCVVCPACSQESRCAAAAPLAVPLAELPRQPPLRLLSDVLIHQQSAKSRSLRSISATCCRRRSSCPAGTHSPPRSPVDRQHSKRRQSQCRIVSFRREAHHYPVCRYPTGACHDASTAWSDTFDAAGDGSSHADRPAGPAGLRHITLSSHHGLQRLTNAAHAAPDATC